MKSDQFEIITDYQRMQPGKCERGVAIVEYALLCALIGVTVAAALYDVAYEMSQLFKDAGSEVASSGLHE